MIAVPEAPEVRHATLPPLRSVARDDGALASYDVALLAIDHSCLDLPWLVRHSRLLVGTRGATRGVPGCDVPMA